MNIGLIIGLVAGFGTLLFAILVAGGQVLMFWDAPSVIITLGGAWCAMMVSYPFSMLMQLPTLMRIAIFPVKFNPVELIVTLVQFSEKSRREGLLALEDDLDSLDDLFLKKGLQLVVDGTDPELVRIILETDIDQMAERHGTGKKIFDDFAGLAPSFGMVGTLMGLILLLANLSDKSMVGPYLSVALITTLYGAVVAYLVFTPFSTALDLSTGEEIVFKSVAVMGVLSIQAGDNPRILKEKLVAFIPPELRGDLLEDKGE
ncbi:MAG: MotA/TolQ/ExbB proton channel family protein [Leptospirales bacterium]|nr:MotA/TolQ/ExbB proton channel family protein [Leptospirales bacterium]